MAKSPEEQHPQKAFGWAARDSSGILSPFNFSRRSVFLWANIQMCLDFGTPKQFWVLILFFSPIFTRIFLVFFLFFIFYSIHSNQVFSPLQFKLLFPPAVKKKVFLWHQNISVFFFFMATFYGDFSINFFFKKGKLTFWFFSNVYVKRQRFIISFF